MELINLSAISTLPRQRRASFDERVLAQQHNASIRMGEVLMWDMLDPGLCHIRQALWQHGRRVGGTDRCISRKWLFWRSC
jgi:hypothetical protein